MEATAPVCALYTLNTSSSSVLTCAYLAVFLQYGDDHVKEVEELWGALCCWRKNIRITLNFLIHIARTSGHSALLQQVKKIVVCFARTQQQEIVEEVIEELKVGVGVACGCGGTYVRCTCGVGWK